MMLTSDKKRDENWAKQEDTMNELRGLVSDLNYKVDNMDKRVTKIDNQVASLTEEVGQIGDFLDGDFADWKRRRKKQVPKSRKAAGAEKKHESKVKKNDD